MSDTFDYLIVGGGTAGCVLAGRLSEDPLVRVALLEAGPADDSAVVRCPSGVALLARTGRANWNFTTVAQPGLNGRSGDQPQGQLLGGSSAIGHMVYRRGPARDYDRWAAEGNPGWAFADLLPYFERAEAALQVRTPATPNPASLAFVQAAAQADLEGIDLHQVTQHAGERVSAASAYVTRHLARPNLAVITGAHATRILLEGKRAVGIEYGHEGYLKQLRCRGEVLLCAGALQSPQILMLSGIGPHDHLVQNGIATRHHLPGVGQNLHDRPVVTLSAKAPTALALPSLSLGGAWRLWRGLAEWRHHRTGMLASNLAEAGGPIFSQPGEPQPDLQLDFVIRPLADQGRKLVPGRGYALQIGLLHPKSRGSVSLDGKAPFTAPQIDPNLLGDRDDMERLLRGFRTGRVLLSQPALAALGGREMQASARMDRDLPLEHFIRDHTGSACQPAGSCRMGRGPHDVVDAELRVHGLAGLRVVDASVMPQIVGADNLSTVAMLAEKAADLLVR